MTPEEIDALGAKVNGLVQQSSDYGKRLDVLGLNLANLDAGVNAGLYETGVRLTKLENPPPKPPSVVSVWATKVFAFVKSKSTVVAWVLIIGAVALGLYYNNQPTPDDLDGKKLDELIVSVNNFQNKFAVFQLDTSVRLAKLENLPPVPPGPTPTPTPIPVKGFRVIFVWETGKALTKEQENTIYSPAVEAYLNSKCADGKRGWRKWDDDIDVSKETETFKQIWAATKSSLGTLPAIVIMTDQKGLVHPMPATEDETLTLLRKYGGN